MELDHAECLGGQLSRQSPRGRERLIPGLFGLCLVSQQVAERHPKTVFDRVIHIFAIRSTPMSRKRSFMSSHTSFFAAGLRSRYDG